MTAVKVRASTASDGDAPDTIDRIPALDVSDHIPPTFSAQERRLDLLRGDIVVAMNGVAMYLEFANSYLAIGDDERLFDATAAVRDRFLAFVSLVRRLRDEVHSAEITGQAAEEWRAERDAARRRSPRREEAA